MEQPPSTALAAAEMYLLSSPTAAAHGLEDFADTPKPFSMASEALPSLSPCPTTIQREIQTHSTT